MERFLLVLLSISLLALSACQTSPETSEPAKNSVPVESPMAEKDDKTEDTLRVDKGLLSVEVTIPSFLLDDISEEDVQQAVKENGYTKYNMNDDGSVTYTMPKGKWKEMLADLKSTLDESITELLTGEDRVVSFKDIEYTEDFSEFNIYVDPEEMGVWDTLSSFVLYFTGGLYQSFAGHQGDEIDVVVNYLDYETKELIESGSLREMGEAFSETSETSLEPNESIDALPLQISESMVHDGASEFVVEYSNLTERVTPPSPSDFYTYYQAGEGKIYLDICLSYKNLRSSAKQAEGIISGHVLYGGEYQYPGFSVIEESSRSDFTYSSISSIDPLTTEYLHYLVEMPIEVGESDGQILTLLTIDDTKYEIIVREGKDANVAKPNARAVTKTNGKVKQNELIVIPRHAEFSLESSQIAAKITPPQPGDFHTYYEADDGKMYIDVCFSYKNWKPTGVRADSVISAKLVYDNEFTYQGFSILEESNRGDFTYTSIEQLAPLTTEYIHFLFEVPSEVSESEKSLELQFSIGGNDYSYVIR